MSSQQLLTDAANAFDIAVFSEQGQVPGYQHGPAPAERVGIKLLPPPDARVARSWTSNEVTLEYGPTALGSTSITARVDWIYEPQALRPLSTLWGPLGVSLLPFPKIVAPTMTDRAAPNLATPVPDVLKVTPTLSLSVANALPYSHKLPPISIIVPYLPVPSLLLIGRHKWKTQRPRDKNDLLAFVPQDPADLRTIADNLNAVRDFVDQLLSRARFFGITPISNLSIVPSSIADAMSRITETRLPRLGVADEKNRIRNFANLKAEDRTWWWDINWDNLATSTLFLGRRHDRALLSNYFDSDSREGQMELRIEGVELQSQSDVGTETINLGFGFVRVEDFTSIKKGTTELDLKPFYKDTSAGGSARMSKNLESTPGWWFLGRDVGDMDNEVSSAEFIEASTLPT